MNQKLAGTIVGLIIAMIVVGSLLTWYNHLFYFKHLHWWQWCILAIPSIWAGHVFKKVWPKLLGFVFIAAIAVQLLAWMGIVATPLFR